MKHDILVTCSVFRIGQKIYDEDVVSIPVERNPVKIICSQQDFKELKTVETRLLYDMISFIRKNDGMDCLGIIGRFPTQEDRDNYNIRGDTVSWIWPEYAKSEEYKRMLPSLIK